MKAVSTPAVHYLWQRTPSPESSSMPPARDQVQRRDRQSCWPLGLIVWASCMQRLPSMRANVIQ